MATKGAKTRERILSEAKQLILARGFSGTSLDGILKATDLTKGAFFYHFKNKDELARAVIEHSWAVDYQTFRGFAERARSLADDPLQRALIFLRLFEEVLEAHESEPLSCLFACYLHEREQFDAETHAFLDQGLRQWHALYVEVFEPIFETRSPAVPVTASELAEMVASIVEGGFVLSRARGEGGVSVRTCKQFRRYLQLVFPDSPGHAAAA